LDNILQAGDVLFTSSKRLLGRLIRWGERSPGEAVPDTNHVAIVVAGGSFENAWVVEAERTVQRNRLALSHGSDLVFGYRPKTIPIEALSQVVRHAVARVGEGYGWLELASQLVDAKLLGGHVVFRHAGLVDKLPICSRLVAEAFGVQGYTFGVPGYAADPDTMQQFCNAHPELYDLVLDYAPENES
jgi:hypothetical protein